MPPGPSILETAEFYGVTNRDLAERTGYALEDMDAILRGDAPLTVELAMLLERILGMSANLLLRLEKDYQRQKLNWASKENSGIEKSILKSSAVLELKKRGIISSIEQNNSNAISDVLKFYKVGTLDDLNKLRCDSKGTVLKHKRGDRQSDRLSTIAWLRLCEMAAEKIECQVYRKKAFQASLKDIRGLTVKTPEEFQPELIQICAEAGVAVVCVPEFPFVYVKGAAKWLTKDKIMIAINLQDNTNDVFWFTFFHEAAHILLGRKLFLSDYTEIHSEHDTACSEEEMDKFAERLLIPHKYRKELSQINTEQEVCDFAKKIGIAPGIVVGRLQYYKRLASPQQFEGLKQHFKWR